MVGLTQVVVVHSEGPIDNVELFHGLRRNVGHLLDHPGQERRARVVPHARWSALIEKEASGFLTAWVDGEVDGWMGGWMHE